LGMVASVATLRLIEPHDKQAQVLVGILSLNLFFLAFDTIDSFFQSQVQSKITVWAKNLAFLIFAGVRIALVYSKAPVWCFAVANVGEIGLGAAGLVIGYRLSGGKMLSWRVHRPRAVYLIQQSWPVLLSGMAVMIYMRIDMVMLKLMQGDLAVGLYSAATRVSEVWYFVPTAIVSSVSPAILRVKDDPELFHLRMRRLFSIMTMTSCLISFVIAPCSRTIIHMLYSTGYSAAAPVLAIHIWASVFVFMGVAQSPWNLSKDLLKLSLYWTVAGAVINVALNLYLIPRYSAMGAAIATVVAYAFSGFFANLFSARTRPIFVMQVRSFIPMRLWN
jgi:PST family polysaccharide transporter